MASVNAASGWFVSFAGRARLLVVFGSWCPNCNDEAAYLRELDQRYRDKGLSILGLAFERTGDLEVDRAQVKAYAAHHELRFPILVAGVADKAKAFPTAVCASCHQASAAEDMVFTQFYPVLRAAKAAAK